jgi:hypothetical protein
VSASRDTRTIRLAVPISSCIVTNRLVLSWIVVRVPLVDRVPPVLLRAQQVAVAVAAAAARQRLGGVATVVARQGAARARVGAPLRQKRATVGKQLAVGENKSLA